MADENTVHGLLGQFWTVVFSFQYVALETTCRLLVKIFIMLTLRGVSMYAGAFQG